jgi:hypothetical protein
MASLDSYDFSGVAAHRLNEVKRRISVLEDYTARRISSAEAVELLQLSSPSFHRLLRAWTNGARPENLGAAGRHRKASRDFDDETKCLIQRVEEDSRGASVRIVAEHACAVGRERGIQMPSHERVSRYVAQLRTERGERPSGVHDLFIGFCAVDTPVAHPDRGVVAPIMCVLISAARDLAILGLSLSVDDPAPADVIRTLEDALFRQRGPRPEEGRSLLLQVGWEGPWPGLVDAIVRGGLSVEIEKLRARSARTVTALIGNRPAGVGLKGDLTARTAANRTLKVPAGGTPAAMKEVEASLRLRLTAAFPASENAFVDREALQKSLRTFEKSRFG